MDTRNGGTALCQDDGVTELKGIGEKTAALFHRVGIDTVGELLSYYPRSYDVYEPPVRLACLRADLPKKQAVAAVARKAPSTRSAGRMKITMLTVEDFGDRLQLVWFNMPYIRKSIIPGETYVFRGHVKRERGRLVMSQPEVYAPSDYERMPETMRPVYALTSGLSNKTVIRAVRQALDSLGHLDGRIPESVIQEHGLMDYDLAVRTIHSPENEDMLLAAQRRLKFDEFFEYSLRLKKMRMERAVWGNNFPVKEGAFTGMLLGSLPFGLTGAQSRSWEEIKKDLCGTMPMARLLQGDVGSGKTVIAVLALLAAVEGGYQGALMAPTEMLARQHFQDISAMLENASIPVRTVLLTGKLDPASRTAAYRAVEDGGAQIVVGTHALIQEKLKFHNLALVVIDEQHRFGVRQREELSKKGIHPHLLSMSATPIPRTLASVIYGDLDISVIDEMPSGRLPVKNCVVGEGFRPAAWKFMKKEVDLGHQAYVVCPMIEENEDLSITNVVNYSRELKGAYAGGVSVGYLHGRMGTEEKNRIMEEFAAGRIEVLVSTTVIEVGINVKNATVMLVEDADRFGLTQLHQLRGRIGRGTDQGYCIFMTATENEHTMERLKVLERSNDGFYIASEDLRTRGPGDLPGVRQSGMPSFSLGDVFADQELLREADIAAGQI